MENNIKIAKLDNYLIVHSFQINIDFTSIVKITKFI